MLLTWAAPDPEPGRAPVTGYEIYLDEQARPVGVTGSLSYLYLGLVPGRTYVFHVRAVNRVGRSQPAGSVTITVIEAPPLSPPGPPGSLRAELTPSNEAFLQWTAPPPVAGRAPVTGYVVYRELPGGDYDELDETESLSYTYAEQLSPGERYVFSVRASSVAGLSDASASAFVDVPPTVVLLPPAPPGSLTAELTPNSEALLQWTPPTPAPDRAPVTGYVIYLELPNGADERLGTTESLSFTYAEQLSPGERYVFSVRASSTAGPSDASASAFVDVPSGPVQAPNPPGNLVAELTSDRDVLLTWDAPAASPGRAPVTGYKVFLETLNGDFDELEKTVSLSYRHPIPNAPSRRRYVFYVRALSDAGASPPSRSASVDVPPEGTQVDIQAPAPPGDFTAVLTPNNDALLQWTAPTPSPDRAPFTHFEVYRELPGNQVSEKLGESRSLSYLHPDLDRGETYVFYVVAVSGVLRGHPSRSAIIDVPLEPTGILPPSAPEGFTAELTPNNDVQFEWTAPKSADNRIPVKDYLVYEVQLGGGVCPLKSGSTEDCAERDPDFVEALTYLYSSASPLVPGQRYTYFVRARSIEVPDPDKPGMEINLMSPPSTTASVDVRADPLVPLSIPHVTVRADQGDGTTVTVSWVHNLVSQLQSLVTGFELQFCDVIPAYADDRCQTVWQTHTPRFSPTTRTYTQQNFMCDASADPGQARMYRVRAVANNDTLSSRYSVPTRPICPNMAHSPPRRVASVFAVPVDDEGDPIPEPGRVNICWEVPEVNGSPLFGYELQATTGPDLPATEDGWVIVDAHIDPGHTANSPGLTDDTYEDPACRLLSSLVANQVYWFRVRAYNLSGHGHWSAPYHYEHDREFVPPLPSRASVQSPGVLVVADARASEYADAALAFEVTLDRPASNPVTVDYATADGTATADEDYRATSGTLEIVTGETSKTIEVTVHADTENEGDETLTLRLSNATGARIEDGEATGTIQDRDPLPQAWLARFGRTVAGQVVDAVGTRLESEPSPHARVGGMSIGSSSASETRRTLSRRAAAEPASNAWDPPEDTRSLSRRALMSGSSFHLASEGAGPVFSAWGRFATEGFEADVHDTRLDGDTTTGFLGADVTAGRWLMGAAVSHSEADGSFVPRSGTISARDRSDVESTLSGVYPYARLTLSERVSLWGLAGVGHGTLTVSEDGRTPVGTDIGMNMGALGARGTMLSPSQAGGIELALRSDAFWVRMTSDETRSETAGDLADIRTDASRVRLFLEAEREFAVRGEGTLTPSFEVGVRHDGGDAETGTGFEAGAGMRYAAEGIAIEGTVRKLVTHEDSGYEEWGASGSVRIDPGASGRGVSLTLAPAFGAASSETERLWSLGDAGRFSGDTGADAGSRLEAEVGYGWRLLSTTHGMLTPYTGVSFSDSGSRAWRLGARLMMTRDVSFGLEGTHRERNDVASDQAVILHGRLHW